MTTFRPSGALVACLAGIWSGGLWSCGAFDETAPGGGSDGVMSLVVVSNGLGQILPHQILQLDAAGEPTLNTIAITNLDTLNANVQAGNPILPPPRFPVEAQLPSGPGNPGNHFIYAEFTQPLDISSVLDGSATGASNSGLSGSVLVTAVNQATNTSLSIAGRAFVNGQTFVNTAGGGAELQTWVARDSNGLPTIFQVDEDGNTIFDEVGNPIPLQAGNPGLGFPGVGSTFSGASDLISPNTLVFIPDDDGSLLDFDTFPVGVQISLRATTAVRAENGNQLVGGVLASTTVGPDFITPEVITTPPPGNQASISPGNGDVAVDPLTSILVEFTEPVQPMTVGALEGTPLTLSTAISVMFGPSGSPTNMPFTVRPVSVFDLSVYELVPVFNFPGAAPQFQDCVESFSTVTIAVNPNVIEDLAQNQIPGAPGAPPDLAGNFNSQAAGTFFVTGEGPGVANIPVIPDVIMVGRSGALPGVSIVDLNGFGAGTGNPTFDDNLFVQGNSNFPNNPNVDVQVGLLPPLARGTCTIDGGSAGVFTLARDSSLTDLLVRPPLVTNVADMMAGQALDLAFNNAQGSGCQSLGGQVCTIDGLKIVSPQVAGPNTVQPNVTITGIGASNTGIGNIVSWAPHPNPPPLAFPPLCVIPFLNGDEPTSVDHALNNGGGGFGNGVAGNMNVGLNNLLGPGDPFGDPGAVPPEMPGGLLALEQNTFFLGPSQGQTDVVNCNNYGIRQQIGNFLYVVDRQRREITVLNSNRMTVIDRIPTADPTSLAVGTNVDLLAVTNQGANTVSFIDIDPNSSSFHEVIFNTVVGNGPRGIAWQSGNEDIMVCNELDSSISILSAFDLQVRRVISAQLSSPFEICTFPRMDGFAFLRNTWFAYVVNRNGTVAMYESGPNGTNGWGFDDIIGVAPTQFLNPKTIQPDPLNLQVAAWVVHEGPINPLNGTPGNIGEGAVSRLFVESALTGQLNLGAGTNTNPQFRSMQLAVQVSIGNSQLTGIPIDIAFDNQRNFGAYPNSLTDFSAGAPAPVNGKNLIQRGPTGESTFATANLTEATYLFAAVPNAQGGSGVIDVLELAAAGLARVDTNVFVPGVQSIPAPNIVVLADYFRQ